MTPAPLTRQIHALLAQARAQADDMAALPHPLTVAAQKRKEMNDGKL